MGANLMPWKGVATGTIAQSSRETLRIDQLIGAVVGGGTRRDCSARAFLRPVPDRITLVLLSAYRQAASNTRERGF